MGRGVLAAVATVAVVLAGTVAWAWSSVYSGVVRRRAVIVDDLSPYGQELRRLPMYGGGPSPENTATAEYSGPGWYPRRSPDGRYVAVTTSWGRPPASATIGLFIDRPYIHTVEVWGSPAGRLVPVVSIKEADPASGIAHRYAWSKDSKALLIGGAGRLPEDFGTIVLLCLVYLPSTDQLYRLLNCPPDAERSEQSARGVAPQNNRLQLSSGAGGSRPATIEARAAY